jgi:hypothetical protein
MVCISTPSNLEILIHCHCVPGPHPRLDAPAVSEGINLLVTNGMITPSGDHFDTTKKGQFYLEHLLKQPFPVETFTIPEVE